MALTIYRANQRTAPAEALKGLDLARKVPLGLVIGSAGTLGAPLREKTLGFARYLSGIANEARMALAFGGVDTDLIRQFSIARNSGGVTPNTPVLGFAPERMVSFGCRFEGDDRDIKFPSSAISHLMLLETGSTEKQLMWEENTGFMFRTIAEMMGGEASVASAAFVIGGGKHSAIEVLEALKLGMPVIAFADSGRFAENLCAALGRGGENGTGEDSLQEVLEHRGRIFPFDFFSGRMYAKIKEIFDL